MMSLKASSKQKLNTKSTIEAKLEAIDDTMGQILWTMNFLAAQGVHVPATTIYQDNKSMILLSENRRLSSSKRNWHLNVRYCNRQSQKGEVNVAYCSMENMLADFFTNTLQDLAFQKLGDSILNLPSNKNWWSAQECVGQGETRWDLRITENSMAINSNDKKQKTQWTKEKWKKEKEKEENHSKIRNSRTSS